MAHFELFIPHLLPAACADNIVVHAELPREVTRHARLQNGPGDLYLRARPADKAAAVDHRVKATQQRAQLIHAVLLQIAFHYSDTEPRQRIPPRPMRAGDGASGLRPEEHADF